jgi:hypothetical protein
VRIIFRCHNRNAGEPVAGEKHPRRARQRSQTGERCRMTGCIHENKKPCLPFGKQGWKTLGSSALFLLPAG